MCNKEENEECYQKVIHKSELKVVQTFLFTTVPVLKTESDKINNESNLSSSTNKSNVAIKNSCIFEKSLQFFKSIDSCHHVTTLNLFELSLKRREKRFTAHFAKYLLSYRWLYLYKTSIFIAWFFVEILKNFTMNFK